MIRNILVVAALVGCLCSCATAGKQWVKEGCTPSEFEQDRAQCEYEAKLATPPSNEYRYYRNLGDAVGASIASGITNGMRIADLVVS